MSQESVISTAHISQLSEEIALDLGTVDSGLRRLQRQVARALPKAEERAFHDHSIGEQSAGEESQRLIELSEEITQGRRRIRKALSAHKKGMISEADLEKVYGNGDAALDKVRDTFDDIGILKTVASRRWRQPGL